MKRLTLYQYSSQYPGPVVGSTPNPCLKCKKNKRVREKNAFLHLLCPLIHLLSQDESSAIKWLIAFKPFYIHNYVRNLQNLSKNESSAMRATCSQCNYRFFCQWWLIMQRGRIETLKCTLILNFDLNLRSKPTCVGRNSCPHIVHISYWSRAP